MEMRIGKIEMSLTPLAGALAGDSCHAEGGGLRKKNRGGLFLIVCVFTFVLGCALPISSVLGAEPDSTDKPAPAEPPVLGAEIKRLIDGVLVIYSSNTMLLNQEAIKRTLGVTFSERKEYVKSVYYSVTGLPEYIQGSYSLEAGYVKNKFRVSLSFRIDSANVCAHLPQVTNYIGKPFKKQLILVDGGSDSSESKTTDWPGVKKTAHYILYMQDEKKSLIRPSLALLVQDIECINNFEISTMLQQPE